MTYISRKSRLLVPHWFNECEPSYRYWVNRRKNDGRLKRHTSCDDLRAWVDDEHLKYQYFLEVMTNGENCQPYLGIIGRFIPVNVILDFLCGKVKAKEENKESEQNDQLLRQTSNKVFDSEGILRMLGSAVAKLEGIQCIVHTSENDRSRDLDASTCDESGSSKSARDIACFNPKESLQYHKRSISNSRSETSTIGGGNTSEEDYKKEYNETVRKISFLKEKLNAIQEPKEDLRKPMEASYRTVADCSLAVTELFSKEEQMQRRKLEKVINQKTPILNEMYHAIKHLNYLKKLEDQKLKSQCNRRKKRRNSLCSDNEDFLSSDEEKSTRTSDSLGKLSCLKNTSKSMDEWCGKNIASRSTSLPSSMRASNSKEESSNTERPKSVMFDEEHITTLYYPKRKRNQRKTGGSSRPSTEEVPSLSTDMFSSCSLSNKESQGTYNVSSVVQSIPNKKFKSETTMAEIEQTLRNYEERLKNVDCLEDQVNMLKKKAALASIFRNRWLNVCAKNRSQKASDMKKMGQLCAENSELKKNVQKMATKSMEKQMEMMQLRRRQSHMEQLIKELKSKLNDYEMTYNNQRDCICKLQKTISVQKSEIEELMSQITRMCLVSEKLNEAGKYKKRKAQGNSRLYGSAHVKSGRPEKMSVSTSSNEDIRETSYFHCCYSASSDCVISKDGRRGNYHEYLYSRGKCHCN